jgi:hypothetical protein
MFCAPPWTQYCLRNLAKNWCNSSLNQRDNECRPPKSNDVHRRVGAAIGLAVVSFGIGALMALTKSKKHYVGLTWTAGDAKSGFAIQCDKNDYRAVLAGL